MYTNAIILMLHINSSALESAKTDPVSLHASVASLITDPREVSLIPARSHSLHSTDSRRVGVRLQVKICAQSTD